MDTVFIDEVGFAKDPATLDRENQIFNDYLGDPVSMCERIAQLEADRDRLQRIADNNAAACVELEKNCNRLLEALQAIQLMESPAPYIKDIIRKALEE